MSDAQKQALDALTIAINRVASVEVENITPDQNLMRDLFLDELDIPKVIVFSAQELDIEIDQAVIDDFLSEIEEDPQRAVVSEVMAMLVEELEL